MKIEVFSRRAPASPPEQPNVVLTIAPCAARVSTLEPKELLDGLAEAVNAAAIAIQLLEIDLMYILHGDVIVLSDDTARRMFRCDFDGWTEIGPDLPPPITLFARP